MKKFTFSLFLLCLACATATAKSLVFTLSNGTKVYYLLGGETNPMMRFADGKMTVNADTYEFTGIKNFYISAEDDPNSIEDLLEKRDISFKDNTVVIQSADAKNAAVFSASGTAMQADIMKDGDIITINLNSLPSGNYVIKAGKVSFKVSKK
ncbi:MAG: T9SS type A sorting domain-containing protein [Bacteroidaceae bacterium]|nr:T9SS type A sorting domain-containing protein [Bacteroidaceae bacterium]